MKNILFSVATIFVISIAYIILTAQKSPDNRKYYYAFSEKIYLTEVTNKFLVKANSAPDAEALASVFSSLNINPGKRIVKQRDNCLLIETDNIKAFRSAVQNAGTKVLFIKPCYRYQQAEMYYFDEIIVETLPGNKITDIIAKLNLSTKVAIISKDFYSIIKTPANIDALELANRIQETGLVSYSQPDFFTNTEPHQVMPNDTYFDNQYYLRNTGQVFNTVENHAGTPNADINATFAWNTTMGSNGIIVAVMRVQE